MLPSSGVNLRDIRTGPASQILVATRRNKLAAPRAQVARSAGTALHVLTLQQKGSSARAEEPLR